MASVPWAPRFSRTKRYAFWLVGTAEESIGGDKLPSKRQCLRLFFHHHKTKKVRDSAKCVVDEVVKFWGRARIKVKDHHHCVSAVISLFKQWESLKKNKKRDFPNERPQVKAFRESLDDLFDVAHAKALSDSSALQEDKDFLVAQRERGRRGYMCGEDKITTRTEAKVASRRAAQARRAAREAHRRAHFSSRRALCNSAPHTVA